jgi:tetratricopeptide (TPR) repeat protein
VCFTLDPYHRNFGLTHYATTLLYQTRLDEARAAFQRAWAQARKDDDKQHLSDLLLLEGQLELLAGNGEAGLARALDGVALAAEIGAYVEEASGAWMAGTLAVRLGRYETAAALFERSVAISRQTGFFGVAAGGLTGLAVVHQAVHGPRSERVTDLLAQARTALGLPMGGFTLGTVHADTARVLLREGEYDEAATAARAALEMKSATMLLVRPEALLCWGYVALAQGDRDAGVVRLAEAAAYAEERGLRHHLPRTLLGSAVTAFHEGDEGRLVDRLEQADRAAAQMRLRDSALEVRTTGADLLRTVGLHDSADDFRRRAAQSIAEIAALMNDADLRAAFLRSHTLVAR